MALPFGATGVSCLALARAEPVANRRVEPLGTIQAQRIGNRRFQPDDSAKDPDTGHPKTRRSATTEKRAGHLSKQGVRRAKRFDAAAPPITGLDLRITHRDRPQPVPPREPVPNRNPGAVPRARH